MAWMRPGVRFSLAPLPRARRQAGLLASGPFTRYTTDVGGGATPRTTARNDIVDGTSVQCRSTTRRAPGVTHPPGSDRRIVAGMGQWSVAAHESANQPPNAQHRADSKPDGSSMGGRLHGKFGDIATPDLARLAGPALRWTPRLSAHRRNRGQIVGGRGHNPFWPLRGIARPAQSDTVSVTMTPEERAAAIRCCGFREPMGFGNLRVAGLIAVVSISLAGFGAWGLISGELAGGRATALVLLLAGLGACVMGWQYFRRPVAPAGDADLAREVRDRDLSDRGE